MNSRQLVDKIWKEAIKPTFDGIEVELEREELEGMFQTMEGLLERHAGMKPNLRLKTIREKNERRGLSL